MLINYHNTRCTQVLTEALRKYEGAVVVISHDRAFLEQLEPTHVVLVRGGRVMMEERGLREGDWDDPLDSRDGCETQKYAPIPAAITKSNVQTSNSNTNTNTNSKNNLKKKNSGMHSIICIRSA